MSPLYIESVTCGSKKGHVVIKTERLVLRDAQAEDAAALFDVFGCADVMKYWSSAPHEIVQETEAFVAGIGKIADQNRYFVIDHQGRAVGTAGFWKGNEIGFILHPDFWRQGYGSEILGALIAHGFEVLGFEEIVADVDPRNAASIRLLTKLGFEETRRAERTIQIGEEWFDSIYFARRQSRNRDAENPPG